MKYTVDKNTIKTEVLSVRLPHEEMENFKSYCIAMSAASGAFITPSDIIRDFVHNQIPKINSEEKNRLMISGSGCFIKQGL